MNCVSVILLKMKNKMDKLNCNLLTKSPSCHPRSNTILESFYPLAIFGQLCGFFPLKNVLAGLSSVQKLHFHPISYPVLYSILINFIVYSLSFEATLDYWIERRNIFKFSTDAFAIQIFLAVFLFLRFTLHLLCIFRAPKVLQCLQQLEAFDSFYQLQNRTTLLNRYLAVYLLGTTVNIVGNVSASFPGVWLAVCHNYLQSVDKTGPGRYLIFSIIPNPKVLAILGYGIHVIAEAALFFSHCCITFIIAGVCDRVNEITTKILQISVDENYSFIKTPENHSITATSFPLWTNQIHSFPLMSGYFDSKIGFQNTQYGLGKAAPDEAIIGLAEKLEDAEMTRNKENFRKLKILCSQYISLVDINQRLNNYAKETVAVFTTGSTVMLVALFYLISILLTQYVPVSSTRIKETSEIVPIIFIAIITFLRLLNFINIGEKLRCDGQELVRAIHRLYSSDKDASTVVVYFQQLTGKLQLHLSAGGFFIVRRTVITAILGPVVTFIVILAQFRAADLQLHYSSVSINGTAEERFFK